MLIAPTYMRVGDGARGLCVTATGYAHGAQLVRVWAVVEPRRPRKVAEFQPFELRPGFRQRVAILVPSAGVDAYWLAILAFHRSERAWERSTARRAGPFNVPEADLAFVEAGEPEPASVADDDAIVLSIIYA